MKKIYVIMHANRLWVKIYFESHEMAANYISFRVKPFVKLNENTFKNRLSGAMFQIQEIQNYNELIKEP